MDEKQAAEEAWQPLNTQPSPIMRYFAFMHLEGDQRNISSVFCTLANQIEAILPPGPEKSTALRKLLEAKDAAVRSSLDLDGYGLSKVYGKVTFENDPPSDSLEH